MSRKKVKTLDHLQQFLNHKNQEKSFEGVKTEVNRENFLQHAPSSLIEQDVRQEKQISEEDLELLEILKQKARMKGVKAEELLKNLHHKSSSVSQAKNPYYEWSYQVWYNTFSFWMPKRKF